MGQIERAQSFVEAPRKDARRPLDAQAEARVADEERSFECNFAAL